MLTLHKLQSEQNTEEYMGKEEGEQNVLRFADFCIFLPNQSICVAPSEIGGIHL